jgi:type II secretory pathway component GspD/PulD (secretin)
VGTRYPITTSTYSFQTAGANSAALKGVTINGVSVASLLNQLTGSSTTIPQIQYEDLGITLKTTPTVQKSNNVTVHVDLKIEALTGGSVNNIPILASRQFISDVTIADGQTAMLVSGLSKTESVAVSGLPGAGELPGFQTATADRTSELDSSDLVLLITPRVVRRRSSVIAGPRIALNLPAARD